MASNAATTHEKKAGKLLVVSGPSGVGKSTVVREVIGRCNGRLRLSISATTREPRPNERDGVDYHFLTAEQFADRRNQGEFLECVEVFAGGQWYGTPWNEVRPFLADGKWVLLEVDVDGAEKVLATFAEAITLFIRPASMEELERRLRSRGTETEEAIERRLSVASSELEAASRYQHQVINDTVVRAADEIIQILRDRGLFND